MPTVESIAKLALLATTLAGLASWPVDVCAQAYRCTVNGATVFQQSPCEGGVKLAVPAPPDPNSRNGQVSQAIALRRVIIGMTAEEVVRSWGRPNKVNRSISAAGTNEQWIYERGDVARHQYLYIENGILRSIQSPE